MAFPEGFPYTNFHELNMDWIVKIAKDFLDQYTHLQETIQTGLDDLDAEAAALEAALDAWYVEHSADIQNELTRAVTEAVTTFNAMADAKGQEVIASIPADYSALSAAVAQLQADIADAVIATPGNNMFDPNASDITENAYIRSDNSYRSNNAYIVSGFMPVTAGTTYYIRGCTTSTVVCSAFYNSLRGFISTHPATDGQVVAPAGAVWMRCTINKTARYATAMITSVAGLDYQPYTALEYALFDILATTHDPTAIYPKGAIVSNAGLFYRSKHIINPAAAFSLDDWELVRSLGSAISAGDREAVKFSGNSVSISGSMGAGDLLTLPGTSVAKRIMYSFRADFAAFTGMQMGKAPVSGNIPGTTTKHSSWIEITSTDLIIKRVGDTTAVRTFAHGLTLSKFISVTIITDNDTMATVTISTDGGHYTTPTATLWEGNCRGPYWVLMDSAATGCSFRVAWMDGMKPVYLFGDSYMSFISPQRWTYYLESIGQLDKVLISQCPGINTAGTLETLTAMQTENPKIALWAIGMNDPSDSNNTTPTANWLAGARRFVEWCGEHGCVPVFGTVPSIASTNNEGKNYWIRNSGHRYVDFADALTYEDSGNIVWYAGMLAADGVHTDTAGAIACFQRALLDMPEIAGSL